MDKSTAINKAIGGKNYHEGLPFQKEKTSFEQDVEKAQAKIDLIMNHPRYVEIAVKIMKNKSSSEVISMSEEEWEEICEDSDAPTIKAICLHLNEKIKKRAEQLH